MCNIKEPVIRFKGYTGGWEQRKLGDVLQFQNGFNGGREAYGEGTAFISVMDILNNQFITYDCIRGKATVTADEMERFSVRYGDVLFQRSSENVEDAGTSNVYVDNDKTAIFGGFVIRGRQIAPYSPRFMKYLLDTKVVRNQITKKAQGAQHVNVSQETLQDVQISLPSQDEQEAVERYLCTLDNLIILHQRKCDALKTLKKGMLQKMFPKNGANVPEFRFKGFTGDWEQRKVSDLCSISTGKSNTQDKVDDGEYPFYVRSPIIERSTKYLYDEEAVLTVGDGVGTGKVFHYVNGKYDLHQRCYRMHDFKDELNAKYFYHVFSKLFYNRVMSMTAKTSVDSVRMEMIADMKIPAPNIKEQEKVAAVFTSLDNLITLHQHKSDALKELKKGMLQKMFV